MSPDTHPVGLFDTAAQAAYDHLRPLFYPRTDVFVVCFSVEMPASFENVRTKWLPEVKYHCPDVPCLLVATQIDLRTNAFLEMANHGHLSCNPISTSQGERMAFEIGATRYFECSAKARERVQNVFDEVHIHPDEFSVSGVLTLFQATAVAIAAAAPATLERNRKCVVL
ncbi:Cdc42-like protein [Mycena sanguinolenta]|nr:Cdc42-like protein [Mycena sanguinolenta]